MGNRGTRHGNGYVHRPAQGAGWGGPAKGASTSRIKPGDPDGIAAMSKDPQKQAQAAARAEELRDHLYRLATGAERQETQLAAAVAYLNRVEGTPIARSVVASVADPNSLTDADLAAIIAGGSSAPAGPPSDDQEGSDGLVH